MKTTLLFLCLILFFLSSYGKPNEDLDTKKTINEWVVKKGNAHEGIEDSIAAYCKKGSLQNFLLAKSMMDTCSTDYTLAFLYHFVHDSLIPAVNEGIRVSHPEVIYSADDRPMQTWSELPLWFPLLTVDLLCGECSVEAMVNISPFLKLAKKTKGKSDDAYFDLLKLMFYKESIGDSIIYERGGNISNFMTMDGCDFCSYSELGGGAILKMYQFRDKANASGSLFKSDIIMYSGFFRPNNYDKHYGYSKVQVTEELTKILKTIKLTPEERNDIEKALQTVKTGKGIQFECKSGGCTY
ncbi:MAG: hypothetical protein V2A54_10440 [Bacteroidota bacterium]